MSESRPTSRFERISDTDIADTLTDLQGMWAALIDLCATLPGAAPYLATRKELPPIIADIFQQAKSAASENRTQESRWVPAAERLPDVDGRLWAILVTRMEDGRHTGYIPLYEYYHFTSGWATDDTVTHWLECPLHPFPKAFR